MTGFLFGFLLFLIVGLILLISHQHRQMDQLRSIAEQATKAKEAVLTLIDKLGEKITSRIDLDETLVILTEYIIQEIHAESGAVFLVNEDGQSLNARVVQGPFPMLHETQDHVMSRARYMIEKIKKDPIRMGEGIVGHVAEIGEARLIADAEADPLVPHHASLLNEVRSLILCPLLVRGEVLGVFVIVNKTDDSFFDGRDLSLLQALSDQAAVTVDLVKLYDVLTRQQRLEHELSLAHEFQKMLLPDDFPELPGFDLHAFSEAATTVGGDFFDFFQVDDQHWGLAVADVAGKGIPGALIMAMTRAVLRAESRDSLSPATVLKRVNERMRLDTKDNVFITLTYGILNIETATLVFVRAGHEPLVVIKAMERQFELIKPEGIALGLVPADLFDCIEEHVVGLGRGDTVLLYTDGVIEAMNQKSEEYGRDRLMACLGSSGNVSAKVLIDGVVEDIHQFTRGIPQHDDITLLALRVREETGSMAGENIIDRDSETA
jgi:sigma-B regulation protein RsbU (phosphoserine phosphatase)